MAKNVWEYYELSIKKVVEAYHRLQLEKPHHELLRLVTVTKDCFHWTDRVEYDRMFTRISDRFTLQGNNRYAAALDEASRGRDYSTIFS